MPLVRQREPFSRPDWLFEIKHDGFRCVYRERLRPPTVTQWELVQELSRALRQSRIGCERAQCCAGRGDYLPRQTGLRAVQSTVLPPW